MKSSLLGALALALAGALAACSDAASSTSPRVANNTAATSSSATAGSDTTGTDTIKSSTGGSSGTGSSTTASSLALLRFRAVAPHPSGIHVIISAGPSLDLSENGVGQDWTMTPSETPHTITVTQTGTSTVLASTQVTLAADTRHTVVFAQNSTGDGLTLFVITDTSVFEDTLLTAPPPDYMTQRYMNAMPNVGAVDIYVTTGSDVYWDPSLTDLTGRTPVASNVAYGTLSPYISHPSGVISAIIITAAGHPDRVLYNNGEGVSQGGDVMTCIWQSTYSDPGKSGLLCSGDDARIVNRWP